MNEQASVLIVDDEENILDALEDLLEDDFEVITTSNPDEGLEILATRTVGVVLSDQRMPRMQGHEFLQKVSERSQATRMLITGYTDMNALVKAVNRSQIFAFVAKPWEPSQLRSLVDTAMEHFKLAQELYSEKHLMANLMKTVPEPIIFVSQDGRLLRCNQAALELLGLKDRTESYFARELIAENPTWAAILARQTLAERSLSQIRTALGKQKWYSVIQVTFGKGEGFISVAHDVTEQREAELALAAQASKLENSYRELHEFAHVTAHHLQEPLRDVVSHLQLLRRNLEIDDGKAKNLDFAVQGAFRMKSLFSDFVRYIDFSHESMNHERTCLETLARYVLDNRSLPTKDCVTRVEGRFPSLMADRSYLEFVFDELLQNSIKYRGDRPVDFLIQGQELETSWRIAVTDRGTGVEPEEVERIFGLFQRLHTHDEYIGTGLGLALCRKVVELHGGHIWAVNNGPKPGITIFLSFTKT